MLRDSARGILLNRSYFANVVRSIFRVSQNVWLSEARDLSQAFNGRRVSNMARQPNASVLHVSQKRDGETGQCAKHYPKCK